MTRPSSSMRARARLRSHRRSVEYLVVNIVDDADGVSLEVIDGASSSTIEVTVAEGDVAR